MEYPIWLVVVMGMGIVFFGLVCIIALSSLMSAVIRLTERKKAPLPSEGPAEAAAPDMSAEEKGRVIAAVSCAVAEELGTEPQAIRINSIKKI